MSVISASKFALFVDLENCGAKVSTLLNVLEKVKIRGDILLGKVYGYTDRYSDLKEVLLSNGFYLVYDNDLGAPLADGFYFTVQYPGMTDLELTRLLMYYGIAVFPLDTMGSNEQGVRICTSFFKKEQHSMFRERIEAFHRDHKA